MSSLPLTSCLRVTPSEHEAKVTLGRLTPPGGSYSALKPTTELKFEEYSPSHVTEISNEMIRCHNP